MEKNVQWELDKDLGLLERMAVVRCDGKKIQVNLDETMSSSVLRYEFIKVSSMPTPIRRTVVARSDDAGSLWCL